MRSPKGNQQAESVLSEMTRPLKPGSPLGERLIALRLSSRFKMSRPEFSSIIGTSASTYGNWERGDSVPDAVIIGEIAQKTGASLEWLVFGTGSMFGDEPADQVKEPPSASVDLDLLRRIITRCEKERQDEEWDVEPADWAAYLIDRYRFAALVRKPAK